MIISPAVKTTGLEQTHIWYPGAVATDAVDVTVNYVTKIAGLPIGDQLSVSLKITGTFTEGQGITSSVNVTWLT